jgi:hypothetical protein
MANMGSYCKAYPIERFREFGGWSEKMPITADPEQEDGRYLFLQENLVVTDGIFIDEKVVFDRVTPEWEAFCKDVLNFEIPDFCQPAAPVSEESSEAAAHTGGAQ